jgi:hypothetical protein
MMKCQHCNREFKTQDALRSHHKKQHKEIQPYPPRVVRDDPHEESEADRHIDYILFGRR